MPRTTRLASALLLAALLAPSALAQTDGFLVTNAAGDTLFYAAPDGTVLYGPVGGRVAVGAGGEGLTSTVTRAAGGRAGVFAIENESSTSVALIGSTTGRGTATSGRAYNGGRAGGFYNYSSSNPNSALDAFTVGTGPVLSLTQRSGDPLAPIATFQTASGFGDALQRAFVRGDGRYFGRGAEFDIPTGYVNIGNDYGHGIDIEIDQTTEFQTAGLFRNTAESSIAPAVQVEHGSDGNGVFISHTGAGNGLFALQRGAGHAIIGVSEGTGRGVEGISTGTGQAGYFEVRDAANGGPSLGVRTYGTGAALFAHSDGGSGGQFLADVGSNEPALDAVTLGGGAALRAVQNSGGGGTVAEFVTANNWDDYDVVMRVATDGNVYADGTFHGGGADFAERFEVVGELAAYEAGDVLAISTQEDRHLERSAEPYSTRILGVYATRPGVLLGDPSISPDVTVPVGVVGVVPTKVTGEGGPIRRGDLLVTSSTPGHAMRGEPGRVGVGMVIGKALQDFDGARGVIEVMVNVQ